MTLLPNLRGRLSGSEERIMNEKYNIVIERNSFYFSNPNFEENYEANVISLIKNLAFKFTK